MLASSFVPVRRAVFLHVGKMLARSSYRSPRAAPERDVERNIPARILVFLKKIAEPETGFHLSCAARRELNVANAVSIRRMFSASAAKS
jgi:hypothetical protein